MNNRFKKWKIRCVVKVVGIVLKQVTAYKDGQAADITALQKYLIRFGQQASQAQLDQGTGGTINLGNWDGAAYYTPTGNENNPYIAQYSIPTSASPTPSPSQ